MGKSSGAHLPPNAPNYMILGAPMANPYNLGIHNESWESHHQFTLVCWVILQWESISSSSVSLAPNLHDLSKLGTFSHLTWSVYWLWVDSVVRGYTSDSPMDNFQQLVISRFSPSHGIWITPSVFHFSLLYHGCITYRLLIVRLRLWCQIVSSCLNNFTMIVSSF